MATNLLLGYCEIPLAATSAVSLMQDSTYPHTNLFGGNLTDFFRTNTATSTDQVISFDLGSGNSKAANFFYIAKANMLKYGGVTGVTLKGNTVDNIGTAAAVHSNASFASASLVGPHGEDYVATFSASNAYRYWWVTYSGTSSQHVHAKLFFGTAIDLGRDPVHPRIVRRVRPSSGQRKARYIFDFAWEGVSYANTIILLNTVALLKRVNHVVLFTTDYHDTLNDFRAIFCRVTAMSTPPRIYPDSNDITLSLEESI